MRQFLNHYWYDARSGKASRIDFKGRPKSAKGAKRAAMLHLDEDFGDARKCEVVDLKSGQVLWVFTRTTGGLRIEVVSEALAARLVKQNLRELENG